jgi:hypothetical protein
MGDGNRHKQLATGKRQRATGNRQLATNRQIGKIDYLTTGPTFRRKVRN